METELEYDYTLKAIRKATYAIPTMRDRIEVLEDAIEAYLDSERDEWAAKYLREAMEKPWDDTFEGA